MVAAVWKLQSAELPLSRRSVADAFRIQVISSPDVRAPVVTLGSTSFHHVRHENIYLVAVTRWNANVALVFELCYRVIALGKGYFGQLDEESVKDNFVLIYELLDGEHWAVAASLLIGYD